MIEPMIPPARRGGRPRDVNIREVLNAILYVLSTGCQWQALPKDLPPKSTAHHYFMLWEWDGTLDRIHHALYVAVREQAGHEASPSVGIIDSQSGKAAQKGGLRSTRRAMMLATSIDVFGDRSGIWFRLSASALVSGNCTGDIRSCDRGCAKLGSGSPCEDERFFG